MEESGPQRLRFLEHVCVSVQTPVLIACISFWHPIQVANESINDLPSYAERSRRRAVRLVVCLCSRCCSLGANGTPPFLAAAGKAGTAPVGTKYRCVCGLKLSLGCGRRVRACICLSPTRRRVPPPILAAAPLRPTALVAPAAVNEV